MRNTTHDENARGHGRPRTRRRGANDVSVNVSLFNVFAGRNVLIGVLAHFFLVLVVALVQQIMSGAHHLSEVAVVSHDLGTLSMGHDTPPMWTHWHMVILLLVSSLFLSVLAYITRISWPLVSEKAIITALLWMLYGAVIGNFGICMCCPSGPWANTCGGGGYGHLFSLLWLVALVASHLVDARVDEIRKLSIALTLGLTILIALAPLNTCSALPTPSIIIFCKITLFHLIWHANRLQRVAEATLYGMLSRNVKALHSMQVLHEQHVGHSPSHGGLIMESPADVITQWRVMRDLADFLQSGISDIGPGHTGNAPYFANEGPPPSQGPQIKNSTQLFVESMIAARRAMPLLDEISEMDGDFTLRWVDWRYRHYSYNLMLVIDVVRSIWVLSVCWPYLVLSLAELAWIYLSVYRACDEIVAVSRAVHREAESLEIAQITSLTQ